MGPTTTEHPPLTPDAVRARGWDAPDVLFVSAFAAALHDAAVPCA